MIPAAATQDRNKDVRLDGDLMTLLLAELDTLSAEGHPSTLDTEVNVLLREVLPHRKKTRRGI